VALLVCYFLLRRQQAWWIDRGGAAGVKPPLSGAEWFAGFGFWAEVHLNLDERVICALRKIITRSRNFAKVQENRLSKYFLERFAWNFAGSKVLVVVIWEEPYEEE